MKKCFLYCFLFCLSVLFAQLNASAQSTEDIDALLDSVKALRSSEFDRAEAIALRALQQSKDIDYELGQMSAISHIGTIYRNRGQQRKAISWYEKGFAISDSSEWVLGWASLHNNIGVCYDYLGEYKSAIQHYMSAIKAWESTEDWYSVAGVSNNIGNIYESMKDYDEAIEIYQRALSSSETQKDPAGIARALGNLSSAHRHQKKFSEALKYEQQALAIYEQHNATKQQASSWNDMGSIYFQMENYAEARTWLTKAMEAQRQQNNQRGLAETLMMLGRCTHRTGDFQQSIEYYNEALALAEDLGNDHMVLEMRKDRAIVYAANQQFKEAYAELAYNVQLNETVFSDDKMSTVAELRTEYDTERKERENEILRQENQLKEQALQLREQQLTLEQQASALKDLELAQADYILFGVIALALLLALVGWFFYRQHKSQADQKAARLEQRLLRSQMNPHFIFNALFAIQGFLYRNQPADAGLYLARFAKLMRNILENSQEESVTLDKEVQTLEYYLNLQQLRFEEKFDFHIEVDESLDPEDTMIPPMLTQPFIENAIEHGLRHKGNGGRIDIRFTNHKGELQVEVRDNGIGREKAAKINAEQRTEHRSFALKITKERLQQLNRKQKGQEIAFNIEDITAAESAGTRVTFSIPNRAA